MPFSREPAGRYIPSAPSRLPISAQPFDLTKQILPTWEKTYANKQQAVAELKTMSVELTSAIKTLSGLGDCPAKTLIAQKLATLEPLMKKQLAARQDEAKHAKKFLDTFRHESVVPNGNAGRSFMALVLQVLNNTDAGTNVGELLEQLQASMAADRTGITLAAEDSRNIPHAALGKRTIASERSRNESKVPMATKKDTLVKDIRSSKEITSTKPRSLEKEVGDNTFKLNPTKTKGQIKTRTVQSQTAKKPLSAGTVAENSARKHRTKDSVNNHGDDQYNEKDFREHEAQTDTMTRKKRQGQRPVVEAAGEVEELLFASKSGKMSFFQEEANDRLTLAEDNNHEVKKTTIQDAESDTAELKGANESKEALAFETSKITSGLKDISSAAPAAVSKMKSMEKNSNSSHDEPAPVKGVARVINKRDLTPAQKQRLAARLAEARFTNKTGEETSKVVESKDNEAEINEQKGPKPGRRSSLKRKSIGGQEKALVENIAVHSDTDDDEVPTRVKTTVESSSISAKETPVDHPQSDEAMTSNPPSHKQARHLQQAGVKGSNIMPEPRRKTSGGGSARRTGHSRTSLQSASGAKRKRSLGDDGPAPSKKVVVSCNIVVPRTRRLAPSADASIMDVDSIRNSTVPSATLSPFARPCMAIPITFDPDEEL